MAELDEMDEIMYHFKCLFRPLHAEKTLDEMDRYYYPNGRTPRPSKAHFLSCECVIQVQFEENNHQSAEANAVDHKYINIV